MEQTNKSCEDVCETADIDYSVLTPALDATSPHRLRQKSFSQIPQLLIPGETEYGVIGLL